MDLSLSEMAAVPWTHVSQPPSNGISIDAAVFAQLTHVPNAQTQTHRPRYMLHLWQ